MCLTLVFGVIVGVARRLRVFGVPGNERFPKVDAGLSTADQRGSDEGNVSHRLKDNPSLARRSACLLGEILHCVPKLLDFLGSGRAPDAAGPVAHTRLRSRWRG
jgi:hypothetical protein